MTAGDGQFGLRFIFPGKGWLAHTPSATKCWEGVFYERILLLQKFEPMNFHSWATHQHDWPFFRTPDCPTAPKRNKASKGHRGASLGHLR